ncbi:hypothetical protein [Aeromicrobium sp. Leaf291]|uniref:hypothetical protein n=1 Tax=Aeromicrobium sp. Leaf291 TaxID=1736325 RepID=UPI0006F54685|nr:hypothetical protein [Aeromicrobium sp. Leaf291]KQP81598.1 hypothetical protein ASF35_16335 [Aeromicrobium sp. Leaf291]
MNTNEAAAQLAPLALAAREAGASTAAFALAGAVEHLEAGMPASSLIALEALAEHAAGSDDRDFAARGADILRQTNA